MSYLGGALNAGALGGLLGSPSPTVNTAKNQVTKAAATAASSAASSVITPILADLKYAAIWVGLLLLGVGLIFEGLARNGAPVPRPTTLVMSGGGQ